MAEDSVTDRERQEKIRAIAHRIWEETGRHADQANLHWAMAEKEVEQSEMAGAPPPEGTLLSGDASECADVAPTQPTLDQPDAKLSGRQIQTARNLVGWSQAQLAEAAGITQNILAALEEGGHTIPDPDLLLVRRTLENRGVEFPDHETVRLIGLPLAAEHNPLVDPGATREN